MKENKIIEEKTEELILKTGEFCDKHLNEEYKNLCKNLIEKIAAEEEVPFVKGNINTWAAVMVHAIGSINFLFDKNNTPHIKADEISKYFDVSKSTVTKKSKTIKEMYKLELWDKEFSTDYMESNNPVDEILKMFTEELGNDIEDEEIEEDDDLKEISENVCTWCDDFYESSYYSSLSDDEKMMAESVIMTFAECMYFDHNLKPEDWNEDGLEGCCVYTLPSKVATEDLYFKCIVPVLSKFLTFTGEKKYLKNSLKLAERLKKLENKIISNALNPEFWKDEKIFLMEARKKGIDITDDNELDKLIEEYNVIEQKKAEKEALDGDNITE